MELTIPESAINAKLEPSFSEHDNSQLEQCLVAVNKKHFKNAVQASIKWEVPKGAVSVKENTDDLILNEEQQLCFAKALSLIAIEKYQGAIQLLQPLADAGHRDSQLAMCHLLKRLQGDWKKYAELHNNSVRIVKAVPAACYYPDAQQIAIHPHLKKRNVPQFVLRYLIFHECCHQVVESDGDEPHPAEFMELEMTAPHRDRAILWLKKEGFPTI